MAAEEGALPSVEARTWYRQQSSASFETGASGVVRSGRFEVSRQSEHLSWPPGRSIAAVPESADNCSAPPGTLRIMTYPDGDNMSRKGGENTSKDSARSRKGSERQ